MQTYLFGKTTRQLVYKSLDANAKRSRAIAQNLANVSTPGYQRKEVSFEDQLQKALKIKIDGEQTSEKHMGIGRTEALKRISPEVYTSKDPVLAGEINNVDIDLEMSKLAENQIQYNFNVKFSGFDKYQAAIRGQTY